MFFGRYTGCGERDYTNNKTPMDEGQEEFLVNKTMDDRNHNLN